MLQIILSNYDPIPLENLFSNDRPLHGSMAIRLHLSLRGRSPSSLSLHFEQKNTSGISFRDI